MDRRRHLSGLFLIVAVILYWSAFRDLSLSRALSPLLRWHVGHLAVLFILNAAIIWAMSLRWKLIFGSSGTDIGIQVLAAYRIGANAISYLTPGPAIRRGAVSSGHADPPAQYGRPGCSRLRRRGPAD
jgi:hypothetical protein